MQMHQWEFFKENHGPIFGQKCSFVYVADQRKYIAAAFKNLGILKISHIVANIPKRDYFEILNTSTGMVKLGLTASPLRDSHYGDEALNGFFSYLLSKPEQKYIRLIADTSPDRKTIDVLNTLYLDVDGNVLSKDEVFPMYTPSHQKSLKQEYGREKVLKPTVIFRPFKWEYIAELNIAKNNFVDDDLVDCIEVAKTVQGI